MAVRYLLPGLILNNIVYLLVWGTKHECIRSFIYVFTNQAQFDLIISIIFNIFFIIIYCLILNCFILRNRNFDDLKQFPRSVFVSFIVLELTLQFFAGQGIKALFDFSLFIIFLIWYLVRDNHYKIADDQIRKFLQPFTISETQIILGGFISIALILPHYYVIHEELEVMLGWFIVIGIYIVSGFFALVIDLIGKIK